MLEANNRSRRAFYRPLDRDKAKGLVVDRMKDADLWRLLDRELAKAIDAGEQWNTREAFYSACRCQAIAGELYLRGQQLTLAVATASSLQDLRAIEERIEAEKDPRMLGHLEPVSEGVKAGLRDAGLPDHP